MALTDRHKQMTIKKNKCYCFDNEKKRPCFNFALTGSLFCKKHRGTCKKSPLSGYEPNYNPEKYNKNASIRRSHNCFSYAFNVVDPKRIKECQENGDETCIVPYHQPGAKAGYTKEMRYKSFRRCGIVEKMMMDDVKPMYKTGFENRCRVGFSKIALVTDPSDDYHFYRQDSNGTWSHKPGSSNVSSTDADNFPIVDPRTASRDYTEKGSNLNYTNFCGFYCVPRSQPVQLEKGGGARKSTMTKSRFRRKKTMRRR